MEGIKVSDRVRAGCVALAAGGMVAINAVTASRISAVEEPDQPGVIDPASWAFAIWGVIFLLALVYAGYQLRARNLDRDLMRSTGWWMAATFAVTATWPVMVVNGRDVTAHVLLIMMWGLLSVVFLRMARQPGLTRADRWFMGLLVAINFGWITAANAVSLFSRLTAAGVVTPQGAGNLVGIGLLICTALIATWMIRQGQRGPVLLWGAYALTIAWAIVAIVANQPALASPGVFGAAIAAIPVSLIVIRGLRGAGDLHSRSVLSTPA